MTFAANPLTVPLSFSSGKKTASLLTEGPGAYVMILSGPVGSAGYVLEKDGTLIGLA